MARISVLIELPAPPEPAAFGMHREATESDAESARQTESLLRDLGGYGVEPEPGYAPIPLFSEATVKDPTRGFHTFAMDRDTPDVPAETVVIAATVDAERLEELRSRPEVTVWNNAPLTLLEDDAPDADHAFSDSGGMSLFAGVSCPPFRPPVNIEVIRDLLGVRSVWQEGFRGQGIVVGIVDNGINGNVYPVVGGFPPQGFPMSFGTAPVTSHGSMCAAGVLIAAPDARFRDYRFPAEFEPGNVFRLFQAVLADRRQTGTPHITSNSYGRSDRPSPATDPFDPVWNINHPMHKKIREVVSAGVTTFFAAGNCGGHCPFSNCYGNSVGPGASIHSSNSLQEVVTVAAVNHLRERLGYSAQGPGGFEKQKPDLSAYTHYFGNFGPGRPGGTSVKPFDDGTSASAPIAAGVAALLLSAFPQLTPVQIKSTILACADLLNTPGWNAETGFGIVNAAAAYNMLK